MASKRTTLAGSLLLLFQLTVARGDGLIIDDAVFAHDFERVIGNVIHAAHGVDATKTSNVSIASDDPVRPSSNQHAKAPVSPAYAAIDTNTRLDSPMAQMSFSIFINDRGESPRDTRFLSSSAGTATTEPAVVFDFVSLFERCTFRDRMSIMPRG